jgi:hypothetical protein
VEVAKHILMSIKAPLTKENIEEMVNDVLYSAYESSWFINATMDMYVELNDRDRYIEATIHIPALNRDDRVNKIEIIDNHLYISVGRMECRYPLECGDVILEGPKYIIYIKLKDKVDRVIRYRVGDGTIYLEIGKV